jgi:hypothetical protein
MICLYRVIILLIILLKSVFCQSIIRLYICCWIVCNLIISRINIQLSLKTMSNISVRSPFPRYTRISMHL